jgi:hypothetical protein
MLVMSDTAAASAGLLSSSWQGPLVLIETSSFRIIFVESLLTNTIAKAQGQRKMNA